MTNSNSEVNTVRVAMPVVADRLSAHFGHCECFAMFEVDVAARQIRARRDVESPPHQPGLLPRWLGEQNVNVVIAGGIGGRARTLLEQQGMELVPGAPSALAEEVVQAWLQGTLNTADAPCDHSAHGHEGCS